MQIGPAKLSSEIGVGYRFRFSHEYSGPFQYLFDEKYGWEENDILEVVREIKDHQGNNAYIVLNIQPDVLTTAVISNMHFFDMRTKEERLIDKAVDVITAKQTTNLCSTRDVCTYLQQAGMLVYPTTD